MAKFGYKTDCHAMKWEPIYNKSFDDKVKRPGGGYVSYPAVEEYKAEIIDEEKGIYKDIIVELDFSSLYPHIMMMANLHSRNKDNTGWHGGKLFTTKGYYNDKEMSGLGKLLRKWYFLRLYYKQKGVLEDGTIFKYKDAGKYIGKKHLTIPHDDGVFDFKTISIDEKEVERLKNVKYDNKEYTIKILINLQYGILYHPYYQLVYDAIAGDDCTGLGQQFIKYGRKVFREAGYPIIYTDTDSWYFVDVFNNKEKYLKLKDKVIEDIKSSMPFPQITFDADVDAEIKYMFFFKGNKSEDKESDLNMDEDDIINKSKGLMKKNYIYVETNNKLTIKNLGIRKKNISAISKEIFWKHLVPQIKSKGKIKFSPVEIENLMRRLLKENLELAYMRKEVAPLAAYSKSKTGIQAQISKAYGPGIHFLIPNKRGIGIGKKIKYCSVEEFNKYNMDIGDIDFNNFWKELNYFIKEIKQPTLFEIMDK